MERSSPSSRDWMTRPSPQLPARRMRPSRIATVTGASRHVPFSRAIRAGSAKRKGILLTCPCSAARIWAGLSGDFALAVGLGAAVELVLALGLAVLARNLLLARSGLADRETRAPADGR